MWYQADKTLYKYQSKNLTSNGFMACFDFDWTLIRPMSATFPKDENDVIVLPNRLYVLRKLESDGWTIVIITNQKKYGKYQPKFNMERINKFINMIDFPIVALMAVGSDQYRKPNIGSWNYLNQLIKIKSGFYCGDAAGRKGDHSNSDKQFALNAKISFYTPEQLFPGVHVNLPSNKSMVVLMGMPGSGKTTFYNKHLNPMNYVHCCQDLIKGSINKLLKMVEQQMINNSLICIDCTNPQQTKREQYYQLAIKYDYIVTVVWLVRNGKDWNKLRDHPVPQVVYNVYNSKFVEPTKNNTPGIIYQIT